MKIRFAVGPHAGSLSGAELAAFAEALEAAGFDGLWLSDLPVAPVLDPLLALALAAGAHAPASPGRQPRPPRPQPVPAGQGAGPARSDLRRPAAAQLRHRPRPARRAPGARARRCAPRRRARGDARAAAELVGGRGRRSPLRRAGRSTTWRRSRARSRIRWRCGWAGADPRRSSASGGSPTGGWALS